MLLSLVSCPHFITSFWHFTFEFYTSLVSFRSQEKQQLYPRCIGNVTRLYLFVSDKTPSMNIYILLRVKFSLTNHVSKLPLMYWISFQTKHSTFLAITEITQIIPSTTEIHVLAWHKAEKKKELWWCTHMFLTDILFTSRHRLMVFSRLIASLNLKFNYSVFCLSDSSVSLWLVTSPCSLLSFVWVDWKHFGESEIFPKLRCLSEITHLVKTLT